MRHVRKHKKERAQVLFEDARYSRNPGSVARRNPAPVGNATHLQSNPRMRCARAARQRVCRKHTNEQKRRT